MTNFTYNKNKSDITILISSKRISKIASFILIVLIIAFLLLPIVFFSIGIKYNIPIRITFIITFAIFWGASFFFLRKYLWGSYGKEIYVIKSNLLRYSYNYRLYTDKFEESFEPKITNIGLINTNDKMIYFKDIDLIKISSDDYKIFFETKDKLIETTQYTYFNKIQLVEFIEFISAELQNM